MAAGQQQQAATVGRSAAGVVRTCGGGADRRRGAWSSGGLQVCGRSWLQNGAPRGLCMASGRVNYAGKSCLVNSWGLFRGLIHRSKRGQGLQAAAVRVSVGSVPRWLQAGSGQPGAGSRRGIVIHSYSCKNNPPLPRKTKKAPSFLGHTTHDTSFSFPQRIDSCNSDRHQNRVGDTLNDNYIVFVFSVSNFPVLLLL